MTARADPLAIQDSLRRPFLGSVAAHAGLSLLVLGYSLILARHPLRLGDPNAVGGGAVPIDLVRNIPLPPAQALLENPVANPTRSAVPPPPPEKARPQDRADTAEQAIPLPSAREKKAERRVPEKKFRPYVPERDNQLFASQGLGVNTPSYTGLPAEGMGMGVGIGSGSPFGAYYGWYAEALQRRIGAQWQRELAQTPAGVQAASRAVVVFEIQRDGSLRNISLRQSSGTSAVDYAALRAVTNSNPAPALPSGLAKNYVTTEVWFQMRR